MSLWWTKKEQLDPDQIRLIEKVPLRTNALVLGSPGSGKTNVLVRRAQFVRGQGMPNVLLLTFTRSLTEFVKTGCIDPEGREVFPESCVTTLESWQRRLYALHGQPLPEHLRGDFVAWKRALAAGAIGFAAQRRQPQYDALFVDEAQDLLEEEVNLLITWSSVIFLVGDDRQKIYEHSEGLPAVRAALPNINEHTLPFHYRVAPEICEAADRILLPQNGDTLASTCHYSGPKPATVNVARIRQSKDEQLQGLASRLREQIRVYADLIKQGDRLGVIVARTNDRDLVFEHMEADAALQGKSQILRSRVDSEDDYDPALSAECPICILTVQGCKGLEFRAVHWLFADEISHHHDAEHYYTVVTRAKTSLDISFTDQLPEVLARAHSDRGVPKW